MAGKHIAKKGKNAGKFVTCPARKSCRNGGVHITNGAYKAVKEQYNEVTLDTYTKALKKGPLTPKQGSKASAGVTGPDIHILPKNASQEQLNAFLTSNGVKAHYDVRVFNESHNLVPTGEREDLYRVDNLNEFHSDIKTATPYASPAIAERMGKKLVNDLANDPYYHVTGPQLKTALKIAGTPNLTDEGQKVYQQVRNYLEDYNYDTFLAYLSAVRNSTQN